MSPSYVPDRGDVVWVDHDPQAGHKQAGHRPALVLSPKVYNQATGLMLCCSMTNQAKGYPFEVPVVSKPPSTGVILADQIHCFDWAERGAKFHAKAASDVVLDVTAKIKPLLGIK